MKILMIDDEKMALEDLRQCVEQALSELHQEKASIFSTQNWRELLEEAQKQIYDIAFLDVKLPGKTGLELGKELSRIHPKINLIYVTAYDQYAVQANSLHISGYLLKPVEIEDIIEELRYLRYEIKSPEDHSLRIQCFGNFEVFHEEKPIHFRRQKTKELLAFLIDRNGASVTVDEICAAIFEDAANDNSHKNTLRVLSMELKQIFEKYDLSDAYIHTRNAYSIRPEKLKCDYYDYLAGQKDLYKGKYMEQYSYWAFI